MPQQLWAHMVRIFMLKRAKLSGKVSELIFNNRAQSIHVSSYAFPGSVQQ
jgi:hypothetical protein